MKREEEGDEERDEEMTNTRHKFQSCARERDERGER